MAPTMLLIMLKSHRWIGLHQDAFGMLRLVINVFSYIVQNFVKMRKKIIEAMNSYNDFLKEFLNKNSPKTQGFLIGFAKFRMHTLASCQMSTKLPQKNCSTNPIAKPSKILLWWLPKWLHHKSEGGRKICLQNRSHWIFFN